MEAVVFSFVVLFVCLFLSVPISACVGLAALAVWFYEPTIATSPSYVFQSLFTSLDAYTLLAVPLFILSGQIMARGGMATRLFNFFTYFFGRYRGGLPCTVIVTCLFYGALSGAGAATVAAVGAMTIPVMVHLGYDKVYVTALVAVAGGLGVIIPPSIPFVMYGVVTGASIGDLFIAGIIPGIIIAICLMGYALIYSRRHGEDRVKIDAVVGELRGKGLWQVFKESFLALLCPVIILGGIYGGIVTPTEAAGVSVFYGALVSLFVYKTIPFKNVPRVLYASLHSVGPQIYIIGCCTAFARAMTLIHATASLTEWMTDTFVTRVA
ncbi:MAG: TRAP transporter large permease subunit, partial [Clostridiales Family XIII bacterium]|nr:TRAP transporter large permease subunit [Clostridiales Family XIII bacterium]